MKEEDFRRISLTEEQVIGIHETTRSEGNIAGLARLLQVAFKDRVLRSIPQGVGEGMGVEAPAE